MESPESTPKRKALIRTMLSKAMDLANETGGYVLYEERWLSKPSRDIYHHLHKRINCKVYK